MSSSISHILTISPAQAGSRLDQALAELLPHHSRTRLKGWIDAGKVRVDGRAARPRDRVAGGEEIRVEAEIALPEAVGAEAIPLQVVYRDDDVLVINKPAGLTVHPGAGTPAGTLQNALLHLDPALAAIARAGIIHRLDKETTGLLIIARTLEAHTVLVRQLQEREVEREYEAICVGVMTAGGTIDAPIGRHRVDRVRMSVRQDGRESVTHYRVIRRFRAHTHVRVNLDTGRTHQIRVHLSHVRYPIVGDRVYGGRLIIPPAATAEFAQTLRGFTRQALHAARLSFEHPRSGKKIACEAPLPTDMRELLTALETDLTQHANAR